MKCNKRSIACTILILALCVAAAIGLFVPKHSEDRTLFCTLSVQCEDILKNPDKLAGEKWELVPEDGIVFREQTVSFAKGETVLDVFIREMKKAKLHYELAEIPLYNSVYLRGIGNLYEFDCGEMSGWMFLVNGEFSMTDCSHYVLENGDRVEFIYSCDMSDEMGG